MQLDYGRVSVVQPQNTPLNISDALWHHLVIDVNKGIVSMTVDDMFEYRSQQYHMEHIDSFDGKTLQTRRKCIVTNAEMYSTRVVIER